MEDDKLLYPIADAQRTLGGISRSYLYRLIAAGEVKVTKLGFRTFISRDELERLVRRCQVDLTSEEAEW